ncbi:MAG TPA: prolyl oligopeptidase family serine peptidase, partial [Nitriliruptoraceae bacterium]|nr:prolyl oligopeptidase family serine peptidase [Nitriliruptoraceae bacterium]
MESETTGVQFGPPRPSGSPARVDGDEAVTTSGPREHADGGKARALGWAVVGTGALAGAAAGLGVVTRYARLLTDPPSTVVQDPPADDDRITLHVVADDHVVASGPGAARPGVWGVTTPDGYGRMGDIDVVTESGARRPLVHLDGRLRPAHGVLDAYAHVNRASDLHPDATEVIVGGELGDLPAFQVIGDDVWAIGVHGRAAARHETFRMLGPMVAAGHSAMAISYRNDRDGPPSPDGRSHLGGTEWRDVATAMDHARANGASRIVLIGCSMGGAVVGQVLAQADVEDVVGIVLDAPVVDWSPVAARAARALGVPRVMVSALMAPTRALARSRHDVDLAELRLRPELLDVPTLVVHGVEDPVVPVAGSDALVAARPDTVGMLRVPDAAHVRSWNADPATYELAVMALLERAVAHDDPPSTPPSDPVRDDDSSPTPAPDPVRDDDSSPTPPPDPVRSGSRPPTTGQPLPGTHHEPSMGPADAPAKADEPSPAALFLGHPSARDGDPAPSG